MYAIRSYYDGGFVDSTQVFVESVTANFPYVIEPKIVTMNVGEKVQLKLTPTRDLTNEKLPAFKWMSFVITSYSIHYTKLYELSAVSMYGNYGLLQNVLFYLGLVLISVNSVLLAINLSNSIETY